MSIPYDPPTLLYALVEHLPDSMLLCDPVDAKPQLDGQYRLVCLTLTSADAWRIAPVLHALGDGRYKYTICVVQPDTTNGESPTVLEPTRTEQTP